MTDAPPPEPDRIAGAPHPRETQTLFGQTAAEAAFLAAHASGRLHHAWLITGPRGVGKATLAWRIARFLLAEEIAADAGLFGAAEPANSLDIDADTPIARRITALSEPRLMLLRRPWDEKTSRLRQEITVDEVRRLRGFFGLSAAGGGRRVVLVDSADDLNPNAANALLKVLEEPPPGAVLLLISHQPAGLLPTIRSRCRMLRCTRLEPADMAAALSCAGLGTDGVDATALSALADGSVGSAIGLMAEDGLDIYHKLIALFDTLPRLDRSRALALSESAAGRGAETRFDMILGLCELALARLARHPFGPQTHPIGTESATFARLCPDANASRLWANLHQTLGAIARQGRAVNLDPASLLLDMFLKINDTAASIAARQGQHP